MSVLYPAQILGCCCATLGRGKLSSYNTAASPSLSVQIWAAQGCCRLPRNGARILHKFPSYCGSKERSWACVLELVVIMPRNINIGSAPALAHSLPWSLHSRLPCFNRVLQSVRMHVRLTGTLKSELQNDGGTAVLALFFWITRSASIGLGHLGDSDNL